MNKIVNQHWSETKQELPGINCILYPTGLVTILNCYQIYNPNNDTKQLFCEPKCDTTIESLESYDASFWTVVDEWASIDYNGGKIICGDGAMGNEGFIAHTDMQNSLIWGMFFENTNPIKSLELVNNTLVAINEHSELCIEIDLQNITSIKMLLIFE